MLDDREPESGAACRPRLVAAVEALEQAPERLGVDPGAVVGDGEDRGVAAAAGRSWCTARRGRRTGSRSRPDSRRSSSASAGESEHRHSSSPSTTSSTPARIAAPSSAATTCSSTGSAFVQPSDTTSLPLSSSDRKRISSISSPAFSTSARAWSISAWTSASGRSAESRSTMIRASGVRSSCDTAAVNPVRSSSKLRSSPNLFVTESSPV